MGDLGPAATFIAASYNIPFDVDAFAKAAQRILDDVEEELGWMYATLARGVQGSDEGKSRSWRLGFAMPGQPANCANSFPNPEPETIDSAFGRINYTVWSGVFSCPECSGEVVFLEEALDKETKRVYDEFPCTSCGARLTKDNLQRSFEIRVDQATRESWKRILRRYGYPPDKQEKAARTVPEQAALMSAEWAAV